MLRRHSSRAHIVGSAARASGYGAVAATLGRGFLDILQDFDLILAKQLIGLRYQRMLDFMDYAPFLEHRDEIAQTHEISLENDDRVSSTFLIVVWSVKRVG